MSGTSVLKSASTREYQVPKVPTFVTGHSDDGEVDCWTITQNPGDTTFVMNNVVDNIMYSTNGVLGVKHRSETQTGVLRSYVKLNRAYHRVPMTQELRSVALPTTDEIGAVVSVVDLNVFINGEACSLFEMRERSLSMRDAAYRCTCSLGSVSGGLSFVMKYCRFASLSQLSDWVAQVEFSKFVISDDIASPCSPGMTSGNDEDVAAFGSFQLTAVAEVHISKDCWQCTSVDDMGTVLAASLSSGVVVHTSSATECVVTRQRIGSTRTDAEAQAAAAGSSDTAETTAIHATTSCTSYHPKETGPREQFDGADECAACVSPGAGGDDFKSGASADAMDSGRTTAPSMWTISRKYDVVISRDSIPEKIAVTMVCRHGVVDPPTPTTTPTAMPWSPTPPSVTTASVAQHVESLRQAQRRVLDAFWQRFCCVVDYQDEMHPGRITTALRYSAFTAFCAGAGASHGVAGNALSSPGPAMQLNLQHYLYHGIFYIFAAPAAAKNLMNHLYALLPQARSHARRLSLGKGALFPHSTLSGDECGSYFLTRSPRFHINADIAYLVHLYLQSASPESVSADERLHLTELLLEMARVWLDIGEWQDHHTTFRIGEVAGPDEYSGLVDGNFYTHLTVRSQLRNTVALVREMLKSSTWSQEVAKLCRSLEMQDSELVEMQEAADAIVLHRDDRTGVYPPHDHFDSLKTWSGGPMNFPLYVNYHPLVLYRHKLCEIPEVLLGMLLYPEEFDTLDLMRNLRYYEPLCTHDTPESLAVVAATHCRAYGDFSKGMPLLEAVAQLDLDNIMYAAEDGVHLSAMTASWMAVVFGIGGLRILDNTIHLSPSLPVGVEVVTFTMHWKGSIVKVQIVPSEVTYELLQGDTFRLIHFDHTRVHLHRGRVGFEEQTCVAIPRSIAQHMTAHFDGVVLTIESLVTNLLDVNFQAWSRVLNPFFDEAAHQRGGADSAAGAAASSPLTMDEYIQRMVYQEEDRSANYSGLESLLHSRGIEVPLGCVTDLEIVATRYGLANAKVEELRVLLDQAELRLIDGAMEFLLDLQKLGIRLALVSYTRSMHDALRRFPKLASVFTTTIDGVEAREKSMRGRPHVDLFVKAARKMHVPTNRCVVIATHLDRGYRAKGISAFLALLDVEEARTEELRQRGGIQMGEDCALNVHRVHSDRFPRSTAELEDLIIGSEDRRRSSTA